MKPVRLYGLDLVRFLSFLAITTHHISWVYFYTLDIPVSPDSIVVAAYETFSRCLAFSGFTVVLLTTFLTGLTDRPEPRRARFLLFLLFGWALFSVFIASESAVAFPWDIYPLLFLGLLSLHFIEKGGLKAMRLTGTVGFLLLWIPFWKWESLSHLPIEVKHALIGDCEIDIAEWAMLPWMGLVWFGFALGYELKARHWRGPCEALRLRAPEMSVWGAGLLLSIPQWGAYFHTPLGPGFSCYVYRQAPVVLWSHLIWPLFLMRLSFDPRCQDFLERRPWSRWISSLMISRKFWLAYLVHYPLAYYLSGIFYWQDFASSPHFAAWIAVAAVVYLPLIEMVCRILVSTGGAWKRRGKGLRAGGNTLPPAPTSP